MKKLIINPTDAEKDGLQVISYGGLIRRLIQKVLQRTKDNFAPVSLRDHHIGLFVANVDPKLIAANLYSGKQLNDYEEAQLYFNEMGRKIYGTKYWITKMVNNEIYYDRNPNAAFGFRSPDPELTKALEQELASFCKVEVRQPEMPTLDQNNKNKEENK